MYALPDTLALLRLQVLHLQAAAVRQSHGHTKQDLTFEAAADRNSLGQTIDHDLLESGINMGSYD